MSNVLIYNGKEYAASGKPNKLMSAGAFIGDSLPSVSLPVDTLTAVVRDDSQEPQVLMADGYLVVEESVEEPLLLSAGDYLVTDEYVMTAGETALIGYPAVAALDSTTLDRRAVYGEAVRLYHDDTQVGKFYLENCKRVGKYAYQLNCVSAIGLLLTSDHYGGLYNGETAAEVMKDIIGGIISYTLSDELASVPIYGLLPKAKRRDNLRDLLFAIGGQVRKDTLGELNIIPMTAGEPYEITADEFYMGGSVTGGNPATAINVTEHSYVKLTNDEVVTLYDGESAAEEMTTPKGKTLTGVLVDFSDPMYDLTIQNSEILESGVNYAVISGSPAAVLTGKKYTHTERVITRRQETGGSPNVLTSSACTLINLMNSELVADRLMAYYGAAKTIEADIVVTDHKPGDAVTFEDPFGDATTGFIAEMELTVSAILKAKATLVSGFIPTASGNYYSNLAVVSASGTFTVPAACKGKIRVVLIGGGDGGSCGEKGENGEQGTTSANGGPGAGGAAGAGGLPGKVFVTTLPVAVGQSFSVVIGSGGAGAEYGGTPGSGTATRFGVYSSDDGYAPNAGYAALISGDVYALSGEDGVAGGAGRSRTSTDPVPSVTYNGQTWYAGENGAGDSDSSEGWAYGGGGGGGPAVGSNGGDGGDGRVVYNSSGTIFAEGGEGGDGATPIAAADGTTPGSGGGGGHGGGGGGGAGGAVSNNGGEWPYNSGSGGSGGAGGNGAPGICLIYY